MKRVASFTAGSGAAMELDCKTRTAVAAAASCTAVRTASKRVYVGVELYL